jgi:hypothetical protein
VLVPHSVLGTSSWASWAQSFFMVCTFWSVIASQQNSEPLQLRSKCLRALSPHNYSGFLTFAPLSGYKILYRFQLLFPDDLWVFFFTFLHLLTCMYIIWATSLLPHPTSGHEYVFSQWRSVYTYSLATS